MHRVSFTRNDREGQMICHYVRSTSVVVMLLGAVGCMGTAADITEAAPATELATDPPQVATTRIALETAASTEPGDNDGFSENGAGVFLSALGDSATLTLYVVAPAEI